MPDFGTIPTSGPRSMATHVGLVNDKLEALSKRAPILLGSVAGTNAITAASTPTLTALVDGMSFWLVPAADNTGNVTLDIDGIGAVSVRLASGAQVPANGMLTDVPVPLIYLGGLLYISGGSTGSGGGGQADEIIAPITASGTFSKGDYPGARCFEVYCIGAGQAGGDPSGTFSAAKVGGQGGNSGGVAYRIIGAGDLAASVTITINSNSTTFAHSVSMVANSGANGRTASGGSINLTGQEGAPGHTSDADNVAGSPGGMGGSTPFGFGVGGRGGKVNNTGGAGSGYGAGGGGGGSATTIGGSAVGGAGAPGAVIVKVRY